MNPKVIELLQMAERGERAPDPPNEVLKLCRLQKYVRLIHREEKVFDPIRINVYDPVSVAYLALTDAGQIVLTEHLLESPRLAPTAINPPPPDTPPSKPKARTGRPRSGETSKDSLVISALCDHHGYRPGGHVRTNAPCGVNALAQKYNAGIKDDKDRITTAAISRFLKKAFKGYLGYAACCRRERIGFKLAELQDEEPPRYTGHDDSRRQPDSAEIKRHRFLSPLPEDDD